MTPKGSRASQRREDLRNRFWPDEDAWASGKEKGWFMAPRTLPLILTLLGEKRVSGNCDPTKVYVELLARQIDGGVVEMAHEGEHAYASGYRGSRAIRTWQERMNLLETLGFIRTKQIGNQRYKYVLLVHPTTAVQRLREARKISERWWDAYQDRQTQAREASFEDRMQPQTSEKVVPISAAGRK